MANPRSSAESLRLLAERRQTLARVHAISSFNPGVAVSCTQWEWDRHGPVRRLLV